MDEQVPAEDDLPLEPLAPDPRHPGFRLHSKEAGHEVVLRSGALSANQVAVAVAVADDLRIIYRLVFLVTQSL